ncbi:MAG: sigma-54-dependent Fis family transcriptional regulator [Deltaproteobacteria bacterium]|nr:sigma-54-dependent Fis family transcriptional regulator [Deltaproteobacteria bacterium]
MEQKSVLIVDDDDGHRTMLKTLVKGWGYDIFEANDGSVAIEMIKQDSFDIVLMDIRMITVSGIEALYEIKKYNPSIPVIIMTAFSSVETAVDAMRKGAYDYLTKPLDFEKLKLILKRATDYYKLREENEQLKINLADKFDTSKIIGKGAAITKLLETVYKVAPTEATVLIIGDSGTGKELVAGATHYNSPRKDKPFIRINCAAFSDTLLESELFGHEKGAFTGADRKKDGCFVQADSGSIFLDEVSEMPLNMQAKLLRVLQEREVTRVGGEKVIKINVRVIAATNKNLKELVEKKEFREDLFYRLNVVDLKIPSLKHRRDDIPLLAHHFINQFASVNKKDVKGFTPKAMDTLVGYDWPGNVRELMNTVERSVVLSQADFISEKDLSIITVENEENSNSMDSQIERRDQTLFDVEKEAILQTLKNAKGNKSETARRLGITRKTLHKKLNSYGV